MDEHMQIDDIARTSGISIATVRTYAERYALYLPVVRVGGEVWYPPESVTLIEEIDQAVAAGASFAEIESGLQNHIPSMRLVQDTDASPSTHPDLATSPQTIEDLARLVVEQRTVISDLLTVLQASVERLATAEQFHGLRAETASLAAALAMRDTQLEHANAMIVSELREAVSSLQAEIAQLQTGAYQTHLTELPTASVAFTVPVASSDDAETPATTPAETERDQRQRTPRRMGQPLRLNGHNGVTKN
jgi:DNA-binding transcriptional MerR regulator